MMVVVVVDWLQVRLLVRTDFHAEVASAVKCATHATEQQDG